MLASFLDNWWQSIQIFVKSWDWILFASVIALLAIAVTMSVRFIIKNSYNVNAYKKNLTFPIILTILFVGLIILLALAYK
jgi:hypothetical protein